MSDEAVLFLNHAGPEVHVRVDLARDGWLAVVVAVQAPGGRWEIQETWRVQLRLDGGKPEGRLPCPACHRVDRGQVGTEPCPVCSVPTKVPDTSLPLVLTHFDRVPLDQEWAPGVATYLQARPVERRDGACDCSGIPVPACALVTCPCGWSGPPVDGKVPLHRRGGKGGSAPVQPEDGGRPGQAAGGAGRAADRGDPGGDGLNAMR